MEFNKESKLGLGWYLCSEKEKDSNTIEVKSAKLSTRVDFGAKKNRGIANNFPILSLGNWRDKNCLFLLPVFIGKTTVSQEDTVWET